MPFRNYMPFTQAPSPSTTASVVMDPKSGVAKLLKTTAIALGFTGSYIGTGRSKSTFEAPPYDLDRIMKALDTDSFVRQGLTKYRELFWKEGWDLIGERDEAVRYLRERIDYMEFAMQRSFQALLQEATDQLIYFGNAYIVKSRGDLGPYFPGKIESKHTKGPVVGYYVLPAETIEVLRDKNNKPLYYRQRLDNIGFGTDTTRQPKWPAEEVIHLAADKKPGRAFGTPFIISALDDVVALRQMEEDIQNLVHKELFPFYVYKVGTEKEPAEDGEVEAVYGELSNLSSDGGIVVPERHDINVVGDNSNALDATEYLRHFVIRVCVGLGLSPHHLGIVMDGVNEAVTDRLDIALYDRVKTYQKYVADMIRISMFNELLLEGGFNPITNPDADGESDRCMFRFREIDVDTQIKKQTHIINKYAQGAIDLPELRAELNYDPEFDEEYLQAAIQARIAARYAPPPAAAGTGDKSSSGAGGANNVPRRPDAQTPSPGGSSNAPNTKKRPGNVIRPANQYGRRNSPNIRHSIEIDESTFNDVDYIVQLLSEEEN